MAAERAINMALRVIGIGSVERDFKRVGQAGEQSFEKVEKAANGADRAVSDYTARLRRAVTAAKAGFDSTPGIDAARVQDPQRYLDERNKAILSAVAAEKLNIARGVPEATREFDAFSGSVGATSGSLARFTALGVGVAGAFLLIKNAVFSSAEAFMEHERALDAFAAELELTGNQSDATSREIAGMAAAIRDASLQSEEGALRAARALATVPGITKGAMEEALAASAAFADQAGVELPEVIESRTLPVLRALADRDMRALIEATDGLSDGLANTIVQLAAAGDTAGAQRALFQGLRDAAGTGPDGLTTATDRLSDSWTKLKVDIGEDISSGAVPMLNAIADALDWVRTKARETGTSWLGMAADIAQGIPMLGGLAALLRGGSAGGAQAADSGPGLLGRMAGGALDQARRAATAVSNARDRAERERLEKLYGGSTRKARSGGKSAAEREAERLEREAERARAAADRVVEANDEVLESYRRRADEAEGRIGLEGAALEAYERHLEVEAAVRRLNREEIEKTVEARRAEAAAAGLRFDEAAATEEATRAVEAKSEALRGHAERLAEANRATAEFEQRQRQAAAILEELATPLDKLNAEVDRAIESLRAGGLTADQFERRMDQLAEGFARVAYESDNAAHAWRGFGNDVGRTLTDIALNGGDVLDIVQELIRLPLERLLFQNVESPIAGWIDSLTGNNIDQNIVNARGALPSASQVLGASVQVSPAADAAALSLTSVQTAAAGAAQALSVLPAAVGNPIVDLTGEAEQASVALAGLNPVTAQLGNTMTSVLGLLAGGAGGGGGLGGVLQFGLGLAGAAFGGGGGGGPLASLVPDVTANIAANPGLFASGTDRVPVGRPFYVGENGRELMELTRGGGLQVYSHQETRRREASSGAQPVLNQTINIPKGADPRRTASTVNRATQTALSRASRKGLAA